MTDPVPGRRAGSSTTSQDTTQSFFVKGDDSSSSDSHKHVGGDDDVYILNTQSGAFQLHRKTLRDTLAELKPQAHVSVRHLSTEHTEAFRHIVEALRLLHGSQGLYDLVLTDIRAAFADVKDIKPGTVAAFFIGCFNDDKFPGPMGCSPKCAASLPPAEGTPGYANCDDLVLIYSDCLFSSLNEKRSSHAYIYIGEPDFAGFSADNLRQLRDAGIENASLIFGNQDGTYREVTSALTIDQLPHKADSNGNGGQTEPTQTDSTTTNNGAGVALAIIIIIIVILLLALLYRNYSS